MSAAFGIEGGRPFNHYICEKCGAITIAKHEHDGVTPFMLGCWATPGCKGTAMSRFYRGPQGEEQRPHVVWYRPQSEAELEAALNQEPNVDHREWMREHYENGGCLMRDVKGEW